ncbi:MAG TPA: homoserine dehydrogenase, partial [Opitutaceae bacterium]
MKTPRTLSIGICGMGTVGQGVWRHFGRLKAELEARLGARIELKRAAVRSLKKKRGVRIPASRLTTDPLSIATDPGIDIVCELMGGTGVARQVTLEALKRGKIVVSANKALICAHGAEIFAA